MQRRNLLIGMGSIAAGGAATIGTGAFTSVTADRVVSVSVAGDSSAYLGMQGAGSNSDYIDTTGGEVKIDLNGLEDTASGSGTGVNPDATTTIDDVLQITNQGTQQVEVDLTAPSPTSGSNAVSIASDPAADSDVVGVYIDSGDVSGNANRVDDGTVDLPVGETATLSLVIETSTGTGSLSGTLQVEANADSTDGESAGPS